MTAATQQAGSPDNEPVRVNHTVRNIVIALIVVAVMSAGRVVERGDVYNVFAAPQQAVTKRFIATVSGSAIGSITYEFSGDDALVRDFLGGAATFQRCHRLRHDVGPHRLRGRHRRSRIGCRPRPCRSRPRQTKRRRDESLVPCIRHRRPPDRLDGYQKFDQTVTWTAVIIMIVLVQIVQGIANAIAKRILKLQR